MGIGSRIKAERTGAGLEQAGLASLCGVSVAAVDAWENDVDAADSNSLFVMSNIFKCSVAYLLGTTGRRG